MLRILLVLIGVTFVTSHLDARIRHKTFKKDDGALHFSVIGSGPYTPAELALLKRYVALEGRLKQSRFSVHLGGIFPDANQMAPEKDFERVSKILKASKIPVYVVPGDNEWNKTFDPKRSWKYWRWHFIRFEKNFPKRIPMIHQLERQENFAGAERGVLYIGINLSEGSDNNPKEWMKRYADNLSWIKSQFAAQKEKVHAAVVFAHDLPAQKPKSFEEPFRKLCKEFALPVMLIHANDGGYENSQPWPEKNITRLQVGPLGGHAPLRVSVVKKGDESRFVVDRRLEDLRWQKVRQVPSRVLLAGPYLQDQSSTSIVLSWRSAVQMNGRIKYHQEGGEQVHRVRPNQIKETKIWFEKSSEVQYQYDALITDLEPGKKYFYSLYDDDAFVSGRNPEHYFKTSPRQNDNSSFRFWVLGESGTGGIAQNSVAKTVLKDLDKNGGFDFMLHLGGLTGLRGSTSEFLDQFFIPYARILTRTPCWTAFGHPEVLMSNSQENSGPFYNFFNYPQKGEYGGAESGTEAYYSFIHGNAHFVCLNSVDVPRAKFGDMMKWLEKDLERVDTKWLIAYWYHSPYTYGSVSADQQQNMNEMRRFVLPLLEKHGVDVVFSAGSKIYERSRLIDRAYGQKTTVEHVVIDEGDGDSSGDGSYRKSERRTQNEGCVYVVMGAGGKQLERLGTSPVMVRSLREHGSVFVELSGEKLEAKFVNLLGEVKDRFQILKEGKAHAERVTNPKKPGFWIGSLRAKKIVGRFLSTPQKGKPSQLVFDIPEHEVPLKIKFEWDTSFKAWDVKPPNINIDHPARKAGQVRFEVMVDQLHPMLKPYVDITYGEKSVHGVVEIVDPKSNASL